MSYSIYIFVWHPCQFLYIYTVYKCKWKNRNSSLNWCTLQLKHTSILLPCSSWRTWIWTFRLCMKISQIIDVFNENSLRTLNVRCLQSHCHIGVTIAVLFCSFSFCCCCFSPFVFLWTHHTNSNVPKVYLTSRVLYIAKNPPSNHNMTNKQSIHPQSYLIFECIVSK